MLAVGWCAVLEARSPCTGSVCPSALAADRILTCASRWTWPLCRDRRAWADLGSETAEERSRSPHAFPAAGILRLLLSCGPVQPARHRRPVPNHVRDLVPPLEDLGQQECAVRVAKAARRKRPEAKSRCRQAQALTSHRAGARRLGCPDQAGFQSITRSSTLDLPFHWLTIGSNASRTLRCCQRVSA